MDNRESFEEHKKDFQNFTGLTLNPSDKETMSLFFQYMQVRAIYDIVENTGRQSSRLSDIWEVLNSRLG